MAKKKEEVVEPILEDEKVETEEVKDETVETKEDEYPIKLTVKLIDLQTIGKTHVKINDILIPYTRDGKKIVLTINNSTHKKVVQHLLDKEV